MSNSVDVEKDVLKLVSKVIKDRNWNRLDKIAKVFDEMAK